jgi:hypothetical protein
VPKHVGYSNVVKSVIYIYKSALLVPEIVHKFLFILLCNSSVTSHLHFVYPVRICQRVQKSCSSLRLFIDFSAPCDRNGQVTSFVVFIVGYL